MYMGGKPARRQSRTRTPRIFTAIPEKIMTVTDKFTPSQGLKRKIHPSWRVSVMREHESIVDGLYESFLSIKPDSFFYFLLSTYLTLTTTNLFSNKSLVLSYSRTFSTHSIIFKLIDCLSCRVYQYHYLYHYHLRVFDRCYHCRIKTYHHAIYTFFHEGLGSHESPPGRR